MPVNMDPSKKRRKQASPEQSSGEAAQNSADQARAREFGEETETDRQKDLAEAEWKNLWDATEVIDMDTF